MIRITKNTNKRYKILKRIMIGPHIVTVKLVRGSKIGNDLAEAHLQKFEILINKNSAPQIRYTAFVHEVIEFINFIYELKLPHNKITILETALQSLALVDDKTLPNNGDSK